MTNSNKHTGIERRGPNALAVQTFINAASLIKTSEKAFRRYTRLINAAARIYLSVGSNRKDTQDWIFVYLLLIFHLLSFFCCCRSSLHFCLITSLGLTADFTDSVSCFVLNNSMKIFRSWFVLLFLILVPGDQEKIEEEKSWDDGLFFHDKRIKRACGDWNTVWCADQKVHSDVRCLANYRC